MGRIVIVISSCVATVFLHICFCWFQNGLGRIQPRRCALSFHWVAAREFPRWNFGHERLLASRFENETETARHARVARPWKYGPSCAIRNGRENQIQIDGNGSQELQSQFLSHSAHRESFRIGGCHGIFEGGSARRPIHKDNVEGSKGNERQGAQGGNSQGWTQCTWAYGKVGIYQIDSRLPGWEGLIK